MFLFSAVGPQTAQATPGKCRDIDTGVQARRVSMTLRKRLKAGALVMTAIGLGLSTATVGMYAALVSLDQLGQYDASCEDCDSGMAAMGPAIGLGITVPLAIVGIPLAAAGITRFVLASSPHLANRYRVGGIAVFLAGLGLVVVGGGVALLPGRGSYAGSDGPGRSADLAGFVLGILGGVTVLAGAGIWGEADRARRILRQHAVATGPARLDHNSAYAYRSRRAPTWATLPRTIWWSRHTIAF